MSNFLEKTSSDLSTRFPPIVWSTAESDRKIKEINKKTQKKQTIAF